MAYIRIFSISSDTPQNCFDPILCLQWTTERPYALGSRKSPTFRLHQNEFHLVMELGPVYSKRSRCVILLHRRKPREDSQHNLSVRCFLIVRDKSFYDSKYFTKISEVEYILEKDIDEDDTRPLQNEEEWTVLFMFYSGNRLSLEVGNRTINFSVNEKNIDESVQVSSEIPHDMEALSSDISGMLEEDILPDFKLECGGRSFPVHRSVLAARSEVFRAMFRSGMLENETESTNIKDLEVPVLESLLKFIYSGKLGDLSEDTAASLYEAADKYAVRSLCEACCYWMKRNVNEENCIGYLSIAESHSDLDLRAGIVSFIVKHPEMFKNAAWLAFSKQHPESANEVFQAYFSLVSQQ